MISKAVRMGLLPGILAGLLQACSSQTSGPVASAASAGQPSAQRVARFEEMLHKHTKILASDAFEGRAPATEGEEKTVNYLQQAFAGLGLKPGNGDSYFQPVPVAEITVDPSVTFEIEGGGYSASLKYGPQMMVFTQRQQEVIEIKDSEMVFVGYGINAPEKNWNDYAGLDVRGKTVVILVNDPGFTTQDPAHFNGNAMTYYGRWTYKYEEAARQGAAAALIIHETAPAAYPWEVVANSWAGPQINLQSPDKGASKLQAEGWLPLEQARALLKASGQDYDSLKQAAARPGFKPIPLKTTLSTRLQNKIRYDRSRNVIAKLEGTRYPDEYIVYMAHWDHLGRDPSRDGDQIFNGAIDNATGTAGLLALAQAYQTAKPERSVVFISVTAEESGLLGSRYYGENPIYPLNKTVAAINMDALGSIGPVKDITVIGYGFNQMQDYLAKYADLQDRYLVPDQNAEKGYYFRSDHFSLAKFGVPALYAEGGVDSVEHGKEWGRQQQEQYTAERYHKPADEYHQGLDLSGAAQDLELYYLIGNQLANSRDWPAWSEGSEFKLIREKSRSGM